MNHDKFQYIVDKNVQPIYDLMERYHAKWWLDRHEFYEFQKEFTIIFNSIIGDPEYKCATDMVLSSDMILKALQEYGFPYVVKVPDEDHSSVYQAKYRVGYHRWFR